MIKAQHGPAFKVTPIPLKWCPICWGKAVTSGVFHELPCTECHASGWVSEETGKPLQVDILVTQLGLMLNMCQQRLIACSSRVNQQSGAQQQCNDNNRSGSGATNFTGD